jgi:hypothetical protein
MPPCLFSRPQVGNQCLTDLQPLSNLIDLHQIIHIICIQLFADIKKQFYLFFSYSQLILVKLIIRGYTARILIHHFLHCLFHLVGGKDTAIVVEK